MSGGLLTQGAQQIALKTYNQEPFEIVTVKLSYETRQGSRQLPIPYHNPINVTYQSRQRARVRKRA